MRLQTKYLQIQDIRLAYCEYGTGEFLIMLHGNGGSKKYFRAYQTDYFGDFHSFAIDSRGHGQSRSKDAALSYKQQSDDILRFCAVKGIKKAKVIGYSDGGILALWLAIKAPEIFTRVAALAPNTVASATTPEALEYVQKSIRKWEFWQKLGIPLKRLIMQFKLMLTDSGITNEDLKNIRSKVMILYAERDMIPEEHFLEIASLIPGCLLEKVMDSSHRGLPKMETTIELMRDFLVE